MSRSSALSERDTADRRDLLPLGLYVHLPWCVRKCPYCDFNSHQLKDELPAAAYADALIADLEAEAGYVAGREIGSVFIGGGTPSLFPDAEIARVLDAARARLNFTADVEITMEANPGTVECGAPAGYREAGVNRLSIGAQSFDDETLHKLGRIHGSDDICRAVTDARSAGFDNLNIDIMHGLPGQTVAKACADLRSAAELDPTHLSWYQLTLEPNTVFHARPPEDLPGEELAWAIQDAGAELLTSLGFEQYEVSAWARRDLRCRHNMNYWLFGDYLAVGAGAHGKISDSSGVARYRKPANPLQYMLAMERCDETGPAERLSKDDLVFEFMLNALRLTTGFREADFIARTGLPKELLAAAMAGPAEKGLIARDENATWCPTSLGRRFLNDLQAEFLRETGAADC
jgi:oxygen-independent coproporphyrinogen-3 oxidase